MDDPRAFEKEFENGTYARMVHECDDAQLDELIAVLRVELARCDEEYGALRALRDVAPSDELLVRSERVRTRLRVAEHERARRAKHESGAMWVDDEEEEE